MDDADGFYKEGRKTGEEEREDEKICSCRFPLPGFLHSL
jgi:hypothetical protein